MPPKKQKPDEQSEQNDQSNETPAVEEDNAALATKPEIAEEIDTNRIESELRGVAKVRAQQESKFMIKAVGRRSDVPSSDRIKSDNELYKATAIGKDDQPTEDDIQQMIQKIIEIYRSKEGDVISEMAANLTFPELDMSDPTEENEGSPEVDSETMLLYQHEAILACLGRIVSQQPGIKNYAPTTAELLVLRQATQRGADIDRDLGHDDAPERRSRNDLPEDDEVWSNYSSKNPSLMDLFHDFNSETNPEIEKWIKWLCTLWATCPGDPSDPVEGTTSHEEIFLGVGSGYVSKETVDSHKFLNPNDKFVWTGPMTATHLKRTAMAAARGETDECPGSIIIHAKNCAGLGRTVSALSQYPVESSVITPPFTMHRVTGIQLDKSNLHDEGLIVTVEPVLISGLERGGPIAEFLKEVRTDAIKASERLELGKTRRRVEEPTQEHTFTFAEKSSGGPKHTSIPADTAWQEMLWVVDRAEVIADDSSRWVGDVPHRPLEQHLSNEPHSRARSPHRTEFSWPPPASKSEIIPPRVHHRDLPPATPALLHYEARHASHMPQDPHPELSVNHKRSVPWEGPSARSNLIHKARIHKEIGHNPTPVFPEEWRIPVVRPPLSVSPAGSAPQYMSPDVTPVRMVPKPIPRSTPPPPPVAHHAHRQIPTPDSRQASISNGSMSDRFFIQPARPLSARWPQTISQPTSRPLVAVPSGKELSYVL